MKPKFVILLLLGCASLLVAVFALGVSKLMREWTQAQEQKAVERAKMDREIELSRDPKKRMEAAILDARQWDESRLNEKVRKLLLDPPPDFEDDFIQVLKALGPRTHPAVLKVVADPVHARAIQQRSDHRALNIACILLGDEPPEEAIAALLPFAVGPDALLHFQPLHTIGKVGTPATVPVAKQISAPSFSDLSSGDRLKAFLNGLAIALERPGVAEKLAPDLFPVMEDLFRQRRGGKEVLTTLLLLDRPRAEAVLFSEETFRADSENLDHLLDMLADGRQLVPLPRLQPLIAELEGRELSPSIESKLGAALHLLGMHRRPEDRAYLRAYANHQAHGISIGACRGLESSHGLEDFWTRMSEKVQARGAPILPLPQRQYWAVQEFSDEVRRGGFYFYFWNASGAEWKYALAGLEAIGSADHLARMREALKVFGDVAPSRDHETRRRQIPGYQTPGSRKLDELSAQFKDSPESLGLLLSLYVVDHPDSFK